MQRWDALYTELPLIVITGAVFLGIEPGTSLVWGTSRHTKWAIPTTAPRQLLIGIHSAEVIFNLMPSLRNPEQTNCGNVLASMKGDGGPVGWIVACEGGRGRVG